ncbi:FG-GAP-like repeat-containing protein [Paludibaculum fermentans]|uniref:VCBS repeat-containing protein n=1 Tax=Paludibaculum fermentans TaxID=1473598 RepID=A0A7S7SP81_PALFE|nr:FG-GAP-like repeat-containing protein [Paludibaculum fermentans]QOY91296.1 VCBS repeat-containing protein [Paludibaculum fermentans]
MVGQSDPNCGPFQFATGYSVKTWGVGNNNYFTSGLTREADGSLTDERFSTQTPFNKLSSTPNAQTRLSTCSGLPVRTFATSLPPNFTNKLGAEPVGVAARFQRVFQLADGRSVLLMVNDYLGRQKLVVFIGKDARNLDRTVQYDVPGSPGNLVIGDFNGDQQTDAAVFVFGTGANPVSQVTVFLGNGDGTFTGKSYPAGDGGNNLGAGDINGDGKLDVIVTGGTANVAYILYGNGDGTLGAPVTLKTLGYETSVVVADINGDGKQDLLFGTGGNGAYYLPGNGGGTFLAAVKVSLEGYANYIATGDFNEDGRPDIVYSDVNAQTISIYLAQPDGTFKSGGAGLAGYHPLETVVTDVDLDGHLDIVTGAIDANVLSRGYYGDTTAVLFGNGDGTFSGMPTFALPRSATIMVNADFNGDGISDLVMANGTAGGASIVLGSATGVPAAPTAIPLPPTNGRKPTVTSILVADFNTDGKQDLALVLDGGTSVSILNGKGDGTFDAPISRPTPAPVTVVAVGDFNGDGQLDLAGTVQSGANPPISTLMIFLAAGGFYLPAGSLTIGTNVTQLEVGDFNKDGKLDFLALDKGVFGSVNGSISLIAGNGNGSFQNPVSLAATGQTTRMQLGDLNGDGITDVIAGGQTPSYSFRLFELLGKQGGGFEPVVQIPTAFGPQDIGIGDLNGDGIPDLAIPHCCGDTSLGFYQGVGDGTFGAETFLPVISSPNILKLIDYDGDGRLDVVIGTQSSGSSGALAFLRNVYSRVNTLALANTASGAAATTIAPQSMVTAKGKNLTTGDETGDPASLPETLAGARIKLVDSAGVEFAAKLYSASKTSIRFIVPDAAAGAATITLTGADGQVWTTTAQIANVSPGLCTVNAATGLAQGYLVRVDPDGTQTPMEFAVTNPDTGAQDPVAIDLGPDGTQVFLVLYGTGLRFVSAPEAGSVSVGGEASAPAIAANPGYPGLDEMRFLLPRTLIGRGDVDIAVTLDGATSNTVKVRVQ